MGRQAKRGFCSIKEPALGKSSSSWSITLQKSIEGRVVAQLFPSFCGNMATEVFSDSLRPLLFPPADLLYFSSSKRTKEHDDFMIRSSSRKPPSSGIHAVTTWRNTMDTSTHSPTMKAHEYFLPNITSFIKVKGREHRARWTQWPATTLTPADHFQEWKEAKTNQVKTRKTAYSPQDCRTAFLICQDLEAVLT